MKRDDDAANYELGAKLTVVVLERFKMFGPEFQFPSPDIALIASIADCGKYLARNETARVVIRELERVRSPAARRLPDGDDVAGRPRGARHPDQVGRISRARHPRPGPTKAAAVVKPRIVRSFTVRPGLLSGKPVVLIDFGKLGVATLNGDDVDRLIAELETQLRAARELGET